VLAKSDHGKNALENGTCRRARQLNQIMVDNAKEQMLGDFS
jgi:hypothetical protein